MSPFRNCFSSCAENGRFIVIILTTIKINVVLKIIQNLTHQPKLMTEYNQQINGNIINSNQGKLRIRNLSSFQNCRSHTITDCCSFFQSNRYGTGAAEVRKRKSRRLETRACGKPSNHLTRS